MLMIGMRALARMTDGTRMCEIRICGGRTLQNRNIRIKLANPGSADMTHLILALSPISQIRSTALKSWG